MLRFVLGRFVQSLLSVFALVSIVFFVSRLTGDPAAALMPPQATAEQIAELRAAYGLDLPPLLQYAHFLRQALNGDLGISVYFNRPVADLLALRIMPSLALAVSAMIVALLIALPLGVAAARSRGTMADVAARSVAVLGGSLPSFVIGLLLMRIFAIDLGLFPISGLQGPSSIVLPAVTLGWVASAGILRLTRSSMLGVLDTEYVKLARAKGVPERLVVWKHALRNALVPVVTYSAVIWASVIGGAIVTEAVFAWPGLGTLMVRAVTARDFPIIQATVLLLGSIFVIANLATDIAYGYLNPRIRHL